MLKKIGILSIVAGVLVLSACSSKLTGTVTRFHQLPEPRGEHVEVAAMTPQLQNSIEFSQYANMIGARLGQYGYQPPGNAPSELIARIGYGARPVSSVGYEEGSSAAVSVGTGSHGSHFGLGVSFPLGERQPRQDYVYGLSLDIIRRSDGMKLYEGQVSIRRTDSSMAEMMPYLIDALFQNFPGPSGTSERVKVDRRTPP
ncbi:DUF4136 domain-containing protein [Luteithermobacter gelatinilyticus]|uniref:DUF4136 domain-containing protein n=1 Tax=Luteithermobacter gelatinilyticus TaxID=2582913 RepID=UPI00143D960A|nr:DUF4136 domain-containing protein [Luteithermobacter gelatinilyticus]|tara:strand:+ start:360 stop:959 length:600 start_codon:yes stop_codon:yes gene_type:complete